MKKNPFKISVLEDLAGAAGIAFNILFRPLTRPWYTRWGATAAEVSRSLPGDEIVPNPRTGATRAVTIQAPAEAVWPWLAQMGQGRGGLYSYERLENLAGCQIYNADRLIPDLPEFQPGDKMKLGPEGYPFYPVADVRHGQALILGGYEPDTGFGQSWVFFLEPAGPEATRLIVRSRGTYQPTFGNSLMWKLLTEPIHFVMERKMLLGLKSRVEFYASKGEAAALAAA